MTTRRIASLTGALLVVALASPAAAAGPPPPLAPTLLAEADARAHRSPVEGRTGFALARLRPGLRVEPSSWFRVLGTVELVPSLTILDAFASVRVTPWLDVEVGQSRPPLFASFRYEPVHTLAFPDRAPVVDGFRVRRDVGASVHLAPRTLPIEAWTRVGSGTGSTVSRTLDRPALYTSFDLVFGRAHVAAGDLDAPFGLRAGVAGMSEYLDEREGAFGVTPTGFVFHRPVVVSGPRTIGEAHAVAYAGPVRLLFEAAVGREARSRAVSGDPNAPRQPLAPVTSSGVTAEIAWTVRGRPRRVGGAPAGEDDYGAVEIAARYDALALGRGAADVVGGGYRGGALSVKWYALPYAALTATGYAGSYDVGPIEEPGRTDTFTAILRASFYWNIANPTMRAND